MIKLGNSLGSRSIPAAFNWIVDPLVLNPFLYFDGAENVTTAGGAVSSWGERSAGTNQLDRTLAQGTASLQPDNTTEKSVDFDGTDDKLAFDVAVAQAGVLICATNNGIFAYEVDADSVDEITALGWEKGYFQDLDLFAMALLPTTVTDTQIAGVIKYLERETGATKNPTGDLTDYWRGRTDLVTPKFDALDFSGVTNLAVSWYQCSSLTSFPFIDTSSVTSLGYTWNSCQSLTSFPKLDTSSVINFSSAWENCMALTSFPLIDVSSGTTLTNAWKNCQSLTSFPSLDLSNGPSFISTWHDCTGLTSFPALDLSSGTDFSSAWEGLTSLTSFLAVDVSGGTSFVETWKSCNQITSFPALDLSSGTTFLEAWYHCTAMTSFNATGLDSGTIFKNAWNDCTALASFPALDLSAGTNFFAAWYECQSMTSFLATDLSAGLDFYAAWYDCRALTSFPALALSSGTNFGYAWYGCTAMTSFLATGLDSGTSFIFAWNGCSALTSFPALDLSSGNDFENAWQGCTAMTEFGSCTFSDDAVVLDFQYAWQGSGLTSFPSDVDLSRGTGFLTAWHSTKIVNFPALDLSNSTKFEYAFAENSFMTSWGACTMTLGRKFRRAWFQNRSLATFPSGVFDSWSPASVDDKCFEEAWTDCDSLTATSVENILNSLATAGVAAPSSAVDITIDYDAGTGTPSVASAVATLKGLSPAWTITLNGVAQ